MMEQLTDHHYQVLSVPEESAANCIYIKGPSSRDFLLHRPAEECPDSVAVSARTAGTRVLTGAQQVATFPRDSSRKMLIIKVKPETR